MKTYQITVYTMLGNRTITYTNHAEYIEAREHAIMCDILLRDNGHDFGKQESVRD